MKLEMKHITITIIHPSFCNTLNPPTSKNVTSFHPVVISKPKGFPRHLLISRIHVLHHFHGCHAHLWVRVIQRTYGQLQDTVATAVMTWSIFIPISLQYTVYTVYIYIVTVLRTSWTWLAFLICILFKDHVHTLISTAGSVVTKKTSTTQMGPGG